MKQLETALGWLSAIFFAATGVLALVWVGVIAVTALTGRTSEAAVAINEAAPAGETASAEAQTPETAAAEATSATAAAAVETAAAAPAVDVAAGEKVFKKCAACHTATADGGTKTGPNLWNVVGRPTASVDGFAYSDAMQARAGEPWTAELLHTYLAKPRDLVPGTTMSFVGLKKDKDIVNVIAYLGQQADTPLSAAGLGFAAAGAGAVAVAATTAEAGTEATAAAGEAGEETAAAEEAIEYDEVPWPEGVTYANPPARTAEEQAAIDEKVAALKALAPTLDYERARFHELHFPPAIETASNEECLVCHQEILTHEPRAASPAGVPVDATMAWYQTLDTYDGPQSTFHYRHLQSDYAQTVMNLECTFCHKANDPREEDPDMLRTRAAFTAPDEPEFTLRKMVNPSKTCLLCHGAMPDPVEIMSLAGPWHEVREDLEWAEAPNGCMSCHAELYRTVRHNVSYLNALNIEEYARYGSSDVCYGCHGGRAWYRISYPYPRHTWPDMADMVGEEIPEWAAGRSTESDPRYALPATTE